jgi:tRNA 2-selenouridine synthase
VDDWVRFAQQHPRGVLYCFRGGMRSKITQQWIYEESGVVYPRVKGGYKALRRFLIDQLAEAVENIQPVILGGRSGVGKTLFFNHINHFIDLERIYKHRGSVFGGRAQPQPSQIDIENELSITLLKLCNNNINTFLLEDEGANIGSRNLPLNLHNLMKRSPLVLLEATIDERVDIIFEEYIVNTLSEYQNIHGETEGFELWAGNLLNSLDKIQRRLGGKKHKELKSIMQGAIEKHRNIDCNNYHKQWIHDLLANYYDPMYDYQTGRRSDRIVFKGNSNEVLSFLKHHYGIL